MIDTQQREATPRNNYCYTDKNGITFVKVIGFPVPEGTCHSESMWVVLIKGNENEGMGTVANYPMFCEDVTYGDLVRFSGGTDKLKTQFVEVLNT